MSLGILKGRVPGVILLAPGNFQTRSVAPDRAWEFHDARDELLRDDPAEVRRPRGHTSM